MAADLNDPRDCRPRIILPDPKRLPRFLTRMRHDSNPTVSLEEQVDVLRIAREGARLIDPEQLRRDITEYFHESAAKTRVLSLSKRWDNMSLWAKYAADHTGYCLEFARREMFAIAREVEYTNAIDLDVTADTAVADSVLLLYRKTTEWSNEEEVRLVGPSSAPASLPFEPALLTRIILGTDMQSGHRKQIRQWATARNPPLPVVEARYDNIDQVLRLVP